MNTFFSNQLSKTIILKKENKNTENKITQPMYFGQGRFIMDTNTYTKINLASMFLNYIESTRKANIHFI